MDTEDLGKGRQPWSCVLRLPGSNTKSGLEHREAGNKTTCWENIARAVRGDESGLAGGQRNVNGNKSLGERVCGNSLQDSHK